MGTGNTGTGVQSTAFRLNWGAVSGLSPSDGSTTTDTTPALSWNAVPGAAGYEVQIAGSEAGLASAQAVEVSVASYTPSTGLTNNQTHYWRVTSEGWGRAIRGLECGTESDGKYRCGKRS